MLMSSPYLGELPYPAAPVRPAPGPVPGPVPALARTLLRAWRRRRALLAWNRDLPRPGGCARVPDRVWRRHSALLAMGREPTRGGWR